MINSKVILRADLFSKFNIGSSEQKENLIKQIKAEQLKEKTVNNSNPGCWRSYYRYSDFNWLINEVLSLYAEANNLYKAANDGKDIFNINGKPNLNYWTNINSPGSRNVLHSHNSSHYSCVYYVQGTGTGDLRLLNPSNLLGNCNFTAPFTRDFYYSPKDGDLILWPAWIPHEVEPNNSSRERINIVFDIETVPYEKN